MRPSSVRERVLSAAGAALLLFVAFALTVVARTEKSLQSGGGALVVLVFWLMGGFLARMAMTAPIPAETPTSSQEGSVLADMLTAIVINVIALMLGLSSGSIAIAMPLGVAGVYLVLIAAYAIHQFRKGRKRRAFLTGLIAPVVVVLMALSIRVA